MMEEALKFINESLTSAGINYELGEWTSDIVYPYWVGEYQESEPLDEDGMQETSFIITGFARDSEESDAKAALESDKAAIKKLFNPISGLSTITDTGSAVVIFYASALNNIPTGDAELKKIQINLTIKEWSVN